jgi:ADP-heptose:LPS heptosyltransferase
VYVFERNAGAKGFMRLTKELRKTKFDYVFDMQGLLRTGLMTSRTLAAKKVGRSDSREWSGVFYDRKVPLPADGRNSHALDILLQFCRVFDAKPELRGTLKFREVDSLNLRFADTRGGGKPIVMFPDSRRAEKCWGGFKQLTELILREDKNRKVVWAGSNYVHDRGAFPPAQFFNLTGNTSLVSLPALVNRAEWVIANDSGPMHLAAALGVPTVTLWGPSDPEEVAPPGRGHLRVTGRPLPCKPCFKNACPRVGPGTILPDAQDECLRLIEVEQVQRATETLLAGGAS